MNNKYLEIKDLSIGYPNKIIIKDIQASIEKGSIAVILGKNGSGKSSFLKTLIHFLKPKKGDIIIDNKNINDYSQTELSRTISFVSTQSNHQSYITVKEFVAHGRYPYHTWYQKLSIGEKNTIFGLLKDFNLWKERDAPIHNLSDGNFQKVAIARALIQDTPIVLLDEPLTHLDIPNQFSVLNILKTWAKEKNKIIIFSSHEWNFSLSIAQQLWIIKNKQMHTGFAEDIALEYKLHTLMSHKDYYFEYGLQQYIPKAQNFLFEVEIDTSIENQMKGYWLSKALIKNGVSIVKEAQIKISIGKEHFVYQKENNTIVLYKIEDIIQKIKEK